MEKLLQIINTVLANRGRKAVESVCESTLLREELGFDSLDLAELTVRIEAQWDVDIFEDGIVSTVGQIMSKLPNEQ